MKKLVGLALSGAMVLGMTAVTGASARAAGAPAQQRLHQAKEGRFWVRTQVRAFSLGGGRGVVKVRVVRHAYGGRAPAPFIRVCLQERNPYRSFIRDCNRTDRWGRTVFRVDRLYWGQGERRALRQTRHGRNFTAVYRIVVPPSWRNYPYVSPPFRIWNDWDGWNNNWNGDEDDDDY